MNHATRFMRLALALVLVGALALAGCGGDDNGGISADDMARIDNAEAAAAAAMAAQATAEAEAAAAMAAQMEAEADAAAAMAAQMEAEADAAAAMAAQATAEMNATAAIAAQAVAESEAMTAKAALTEAQADLDAAEMALATANEAKTMAETAKAVAESEAKAAMAAQTAAEAAQATAEAAQKVAEDAKTAADAALTTAQAERDKYKLMYEEATDVATVGTTVGAAARAVAARIAGSVMGGVEEDSADKQMMSDSIKKGSIKKVMRGDDGLSFNIMQGTTVRLNQDDAADDMASSLTGWQGAALAKTSGGVVQEALVYSDIERSVTTFGGRYPYTVDMNGQPNQTGSRTYYYVDDLWDTPAGANADEAITITLVDNTASGGETDPKISIDHSVSSSNRTQAVDTTIRGSYDGVPGTYMCTLDCELTWSESRVTLVGQNEDGTALAADAHLLFQADDPSSLIPDPDHLTFGVWMLAPDGPAAGGLIRPIATANASRFRQMDLRSITGSATYKGQAAGYYATRAAGSAEAESGRFTATATLMANFDAVGGGMAPADVADASVEVDAGQPMGLDEDRMPVNLGTAAITGAADAALSTVAYFRSVLSPGVSFAGSKIDKFMAEDGTMMEGWVVNLDGGVLRPPADSMVAMPAAIDDFETAQDLARTAGEMASMFEGATSGTGGAHEWSGRWDASFHGNNRSTLPTGVVGTFQADAGNANPVNVEGAIDLIGDGGFVGVVGSFGARR